MKICYKKRWKSGQPVEKDSLCICLQLQEGKREQMQFDSLNGVLDNDKARSPTEASCGFGPWEGG